MMSRRAGNRDHDSQPLPPLPGTATSAPAIRAFDDKNVAAALAQKRVYRVLGIGHSVTSSLLDLVPEFTAAVPSDAGAHVAAMAQSVSALARQAEQSARRLEEAIRELGEARQMASRVPARVEVVNKIPNWAIVVILVLTTMLGF